MNTSKNKSKKIFFLLLTGLAWFSPLLGQTGTEKDSVSRHYHLHEVPVTTTLQGNEGSLKFYKSNKTASTEDILARLNGISLIRRGSYGMEATIRGFSGGQISTTIDGMKIFGACTDRMDPATSYIETNNLRSIEYSHSGSGSQYGPSVGGSLNFKLAEAVLDSSRTFSGNLSTSYLSALRNSSNTVQLNYAAEKLGIRFSGVYRKAGNYTAPGRREVSFTQYEKLNLNVAAKYRLSENSYLKADVITDDAYNMGYAALPMDVAFARARIYALSFKSFFQTSPFDYVEAKIYGNNISHSMDDTHRPDISMHMDMPGWNRTLGAYLQTLIKSREDHKLTFRMDAYRNFSRAEMTMYPENSKPMFMLTRPDSRRLVLGWYANDEWRLDETKTLNINGRVDYSNSLMKSEFGRKQMEVFNYQLNKPIVSFLKSFNASLDIDLSNSFYGSVSAGYNERLPESNEQFGFYLYNSFDGYDYIGNPAMEKEKALSSEISIGYRKDRSRLKASIFYNRVFDYMTGLIDPAAKAMTEGARGVKNYAQLPFATLKGFELNLDSKIGPHFQLISNLRYLHGTDQSGAALALIAPLKVITSARYHFGKYAVQAENESATAQNRVRTSVQEQATKGYTIFHLKGGYSHMLKDHSTIEINAGAENLLDAYYREHLDWGRIPRPGRNLFMALSYTF